MEGLRIYKMLPGWGDQSLYKETYINWKVDYFCPMIEVLSSTDSQQHSALFANCRRLAIGLDTLRHLKVGGHSVEVPERFKDLESLTILADELGFKYTSPISIFRKNVIEDLNLEAVLNARALTPLWPNNPAWNEEFVKNVGVYRGSLSRMMVKQSQKVPRAKAKRVQSARKTHAMSLSSR